MQNNPQGRRDRYEPKAVMEREAPAVQTEPIEAEAVATPAAPIEEPKKVEVIGTVVDCVRLRVRETADSDATILAEIPVGSEVVVDTDASTGDFYKVCNAAGIQGFCMKKFIALKK